jgi:uncharacterized SAM-dependent methyltransferase
VFVAVSTADDFPHLYPVVEEVLDSLGVRGVRSEELATERFLEDVFNAIDQSGLVIGVAGQDDPRVRYELGYARHLRKDIVLLADESAVIPPEVANVEPLEYSPREPRAVRGRLADRVRRAGFLSPGSSNGILRRGEVFESVVDGTFYLQKVKPLPTKQEIYRSLEQRVPMPQRLLYLTEEGQDAYLELCSDGGYLYYQETAGYIVDQAASIIDTVLGHCDSAEVDFISLGPGNGRKDGFLLTELLRKARDLRYTYYYPYDVSGGLLLETMRNILKRELPLERLRVKAIEGDVRHLGELKKVFDYRVEPNVYSLLGGLDNISNEVSLLNILHQVMNANDCLLLEMRKKGSGEKALGDIKINRRLDLAALRYVGADVEGSEVVYDAVTSTSSIPNTRTIAGVADTLVLDKKPYTNVSLFTVHYYDTASMTQILEDVGFHVLLANEAPNSLFYVCAKAPARGR